MGKKFRYLLRRYTCHLIGLFCLGMSFYDVPAHAQSRKSRQERPNIVFIVADDLGYGDFSCYGATKISTPEVDSLASRGVRYTSAYASCSLCSPSRYSIMTGSYPWRAGWKDGVLPFFARPMIERGRQTLASVLKGAGYYTACVGKWHLGFDWALKQPAPADPEKAVYHSWNVKSQDAIDFSKTVGEGPLTRGFDYYFGISGSLNMLPYVYISGDHVVQAPRDSAMAVHPYNDYNLQAPDWDPKMVNRVLTAKAVEVISQHFAHHRGTPLFLYFPTSAIHQSCLPTITRGKSRAGLRGDMVEEFDWSVAQVVKALKDCGELSHTLLIITSDNGPRPGDPAYEIMTYSQPANRNHIYDQPYFSDYTPVLKNPFGSRGWQRGWYTYGHKASGELLGFKADAWEGGLRVPLIIVWPGVVKPGEVNTSMVCNTDFLATFARLSGVPLTAGSAEDSYSFLANLKNPKIPVTRTSAVLAAGGTGALVARQGDWTLIEPVDSSWIGKQTYYPEGPSVTARQLYNLSSDLSEQRNLIGSDKKKANDLRAIIRQVQKKGGHEGRQ